MLGLCQGLLLAAVDVAAEEAVRVEGYCPYLGGMLLAFFFSSSCLGLSPSIFSLKEGGMKPGNLV